MVTLKPLSDISFTSYREQLFRRYSDSMAHAWQIDRVTADAFATVQLDNLLPEGVYTRFHALREIWVGEDLVGTIWFSRQPGSVAYVYDLFIQESHRRRGYGKAAVEASERDAIDHGCFALSLHVFEDNAAAQQFYRSLGLHPIGAQLFKHFRNAGAA